MRRDAQRDDDSVLPEDRVQHERDKARTAKTEERAEWSLKLRMEVPSMRYAEMVREIRQRFDCGETAAEQAIARSYELLAELRGEKYLQGLADYLTATLLENVQLARKEGNRTEVRKTVEAIHKYLGLGAPERIELTSSLGAINDDTSDEDIAAALELLSPKSAPTEH